jgi:hypothetical protein
MRRRRWSGCARNSQPPSSRSHAAAIWGTCLLVRGRGAAHGLLLVVDKPPRAAYVTTHALKERGWTATMIAALLPRHDAARTSYVRLPGNALPWSSSTCAPGGESRAQLGVSHRAGTRHEGKSAARVGGAHGPAPSTAQALRARLPTHLPLARALVPALGLAVSLVDVQAFYDRWVSKLADLSHAAQQRVFDALHEKNQRLFSKRFPRITSGPQRPPKLKKHSAKNARALDSL